MDFNLFQATAAAAADKSAGDTGTAAFCISLWYIHFTPHIQYWQGTVSWTGTFCGLPGNFRWHVFCRLSVLQI